MFCGALGKRAVVPFCRTRAGRNRKFSHGVLPFTRLQIEIQVRAERQREKEGEILKIYVKYFGEYTCRGRKREVESRGRTVKRNARVDSLSESVVIELCDIKASKYNLSSFVSQHSRLSNKYDMYSVSREKNSSTYCARVRCKINSRGDA